MTDGTGDRDEALREEVRREVREALGEIARTTPGPRQQAEAVVELCDLHVTYGDNVVLDGIDLVVREGETVGILGGSGAGKSTVLRLILALDLPDAGRILVRGRDICRAGTDEVLEMRRDMGMVFQGAALFDSLTVYENVGFFLQEHTDMPASEIRERVHEALRMVDLDPEQVEEQLPAELSGGMKKRVGIARAIVHRPRLLLYDEPTSGLDPITTRTINELIRKLQGELSVSSVVVTHDIRSAFHIANRVALLYGGRIVFEGGPEEMVASEEEYVREFLR